MRFKNANILIWAILKIVNTLETSQNVNLENVRKNIFQFNFIVI